MHEELEVILSLLPTAAIIYWLSKLLGRVFKLRSAAVPAAATPVGTGILQVSTTVLRALVAAPEDGRTPKAF